MAPSDFAARVILLIEAFPSVAGGVFDDAVDVGAAAVLHDARSIPEHEKSKKDEKAFDHGHFPFRKKSSVSDERIRTNSPIRSVAVLESPA